MIVYVVTSGEYSDYCIETVFDNREQAELYCATKEGHGDTKHIEEYDTEEYHFDSNKPVFMRWHCEICECIDGTYLRNFVSCPTFKKLDTIQKTMYLYRPLIRGYVTLDRNSTVEQAKKAILDRYAQWKYEREG